MTYIVLIWHFYYACFGAPTELSKEREAHLHYMRQLAVPWPTTKNNWQRTMQWTWGKYSILTQLKIQTDILLISSLLGNSYLSWKTTILLISSCCSSDNLSNIFVRQGPEPCPHSSSTSTPITLTIWLLSSDEFLSSLIFFFRRAFRAKHWRSDSKPGNKT